MKILIVGVKGFVGSHCAAYFSAAGHDVTGCDIQPGTGDNSYICLQANGNDYNSLFAGKQFDVCINAAGSAHVAYSFQHPEKDFELNVSLVINLLGAIKNNNADCKFINFSSAAVYGNPKSLPIAESATTAPLSPYGYHKLLSENLLIEYHRFFGLKTCSLRVFSAYGEGLKKQLFWDLYTKAKHADAITLYGTGNESRDFIYIGDLVEIVALIIQRSEFKGDVYNVANNEEIKISDAAAVFFEETGWKGKLLFSGEEKQGDPLNWKADTEKIRSLGYVRKHTFREGLKKYSAWLSGLK